MTGSNSYMARRKALGQIARETKAMTPDIAAAVPHVEPTVSHLFDLATLPPLDPVKCPRFALSDSDDSCGTLIRVKGHDSFDAAILMPTSVLDTAPALGKATRETELAHLGALKAAALASENLNPNTAARVAVLNMASEKNPGGGWLGGAAAQEEALCFRSTLAGSLHRTYYPLGPRAGLHTRDVVIFRKSMAEGHGLMVPDTPAEELPVVGVLSVAGIRKPEVKTVAIDEKVPGDRKTVFANDEDRDLTKDKMRLCLRMAAAQGHTMLVLGALGCGAFKNPPEEVASCWKEVLDEDEFAGGWFKEIWFAVFDRKGDGNLPVFTKALDGRKIGVTKNET